MLASVGQVSDWGSTLSLNYTADIRRSTVISKLLLCTRRHRMSCRWHCSPFYPHGLGVQTYSYMEQE